MKIRNEEILKKIDAHVPRISGYEKAKLSAVCIPLVKNEEGGFDVIFEVRSARVSQQQGDICFPGGMLEEGERPEEAALRELSQELLVKEQQVKILGKGDILYVGSLIVYTYIVEMEDYDYRFNEESDEVFGVPLEFFLENEPEEYLVQRQPIMSNGFPYDRIRGGKNYKWRLQDSYTYFYQWKDRTIWGISAAIMRDLINTLNS